MPQLLTFVARSERVQGYMASPGAGSEMVMSGWLQTTITAS